MFPALQSLPTNPWSKRREGGSPARRSSNYPSLFPKIPPFKITLPCRSHLSVLLLWLLKKIIKRAAPLPWVQDWGRDQAVQRVPALQFPNQMILRMAADKRMWSSSTDVMSTSNLKFFLTLTKRGWGGGLSYFKILEIYTSQTSILVIFVPSHLFVFNWKGGSDIIPWDTSFMLMVFSCFH